jgi:putative oxygen-independent coproporphyrinogen III oxidase
MTEALLGELGLRSGYLLPGPVSTIYFGGGTPSLLPISDLERLLSAIQKQFGWQSDAEITLEANPDDITKEWLSDLKKYTPVNRLSIGIQSFQETDLSWMNRAHTARHARQCLELALGAGFEDLTIDLIYGSPTTTDAFWEENLEIAGEYGIPHLSCYCLTVEEGTALHHHVQKGKKAAVEEERAAHQFEYLMDWADKKGYEQYEISNFALPGRYARHNSNYWRGEHYLGLGPSAHSFNGLSRQWNVANNALYIKGVQEGDLQFEQEQLSQEQQFNEYVMTMLRTQWGCAKVRLQELHPEGANRLEAAALVYLSNGWMVEQQGCYQLTKAGRLLADRIAMELFI